MPDGLISPEVGAVLPIACTSNSQVCINKKEKMVALLVTWRGCGSGLIMTGSGINLSQKDLDPRLVIVRPDHW